MVKVLEDLAAAEREGDLEAHLLAVQNFLLIFREFGSINYLQYGSLYLENMHLLPEEHLMVKKDTSHIMLSQEMGN